MYHKRVSEMITASRTSEAGTTLQAVGKTYRRGQAEIHALREITLSVPAGAFCCLLGTQRGRKEHAAEPARGDGRAQQRHAAGGGGAGHDRGQGAAHPAPARSVAAQQHRHGLHGVLPYPTLTAWKNGRQLPLLWCERSDPEYARELLQRVGLGTGWNTARASSPAVRCSEWRSRGRGQLPETAVGG